MTGYLLDTNVASELKKPKPNPRVVAFIAGEALDRLYLSSVTLAEIRFGIELICDSGRRSTLTLWLDNEVRPMFDGRILQADEDVRVKWRLMIEAGRKRGYAFSHPDVLIAAIAVNDGLTVATRNGHEFGAAGVEVLDSWTAWPSSAR